MKKDGHIHTPFCPHGTEDLMEEYVLRAIDLGFDEISFTEHAPLPEGFTDPTPDGDSGMKLSRLHSYFSSIDKIKEKFAGEISILTGLEIDYIEGYEKETERFLNMWGHLLDDSILSVHFLRTSRGYTCVDYSADVFGELVEQMGSVLKVHEMYYETVKAAIKSNLGNYKPKRLGHVTLPRKFQKKYPLEQQAGSLLDSILIEVKKHSMVLDFNSAGLRKKDCGETYPPEDIVKKAQLLDIPFTFGSDAHAAEDVGKDYDLFLRYLA
ncbi:histidinol-phosphatase HisJ [Bacillus lacus]|uniref:Histidinol-phosphatase n=1 Tax=Metabacillus lacus TaxID=1983721 RepID=A0A7X2IZP7_9BACI|nr:histidinol-phosphatase HisJ [Metabacillus lacus]